MSETTEDRRSSAREGRRPLIGLLILPGLGFLLLIILGISVARNSTDAPAFPDADLTAPTTPALPRGENAAPLLEAALRLLSGRELTETRVEGGVPLVLALQESGFESFATEGRTADGRRPERLPHESTLRELMAESGPFFHALDAAVERNGCRGRRKGAIGSHSTQVAHQLLSLRADVSFVDRDAPALRAADRALLLHAGHEVDGARTIAGTLAGLTLLDGALAAIEHHVLAGDYAGAEEGLIALLDRVAPVASAREGAEAIRGEYAALREHVLAFDETETGGSYRRYLWQPNETLAAMGSFYRAAIEEGERTGRVVEATPPPRRGVVGRILHGNAAGEAILAITPVAVDGLYAELGRVDAAIAALRARLIGRQP